MSLNEPTTRPPFLLREIRHLRSKNEHEDRDENEEDEDDGGVYREGSRALADMSGPSERSSASVVE